MLRHLPQEISASLGYAFTATRLFKLHIYKIRAVHEFKQPDYAARIHFCHYMQQNVGGKLWTHSCCL
jgi:hypothetical protein